METFEETSRITNVSTTMFPSLPRALRACNESVRRLYVVLTIRSPTQTRMSVDNKFKNSLIIHEENTKKNHKRVVS
jgi:hypothetical protein